MNDQDAVSFPDAPRLELDQLLEQVRDRAEDVLATQGRLRGLLRANAAVAADLSLPVVLRAVAEAARDLLGARYAALGVIGHDGSLEQFVHVGMDDAIVDRIGALPQGQGLLGALIRDPEPIRVPDLRAHPDAAGFPADHPPMSSFLGVPIRVGQEVFGNLYLTERHDGGEFSAEDEQLAVALARTAGGAVANARLFTESEQRRRWLAASSELTPLLLGDDVRDPYELVVAQALTAGGADFAVVAVPAGPDELMVVAVHGALTGELIGRTVDLDDSWSGQVFRTGEPVLIRDYGAEPGAVRLSEAVGPVVVVPLEVGEEILGALSLGRFASREGFTEADMSMAASFAAQAAVAIELMAARADQVRLALLEDHDRIARDLHDHVIGELFAIGMGLQSLSTIIGPTHRDRVDGYTKALDDTIARIRTSIFALQPARHDRSGVKARVMKIAEDHRDQLGFVPHVTFHGPLDLRVVDHLAEDLLAAVRELISNAARHAHATQVAIMLRLEDRVVRV